MILGVERAKSIGHGSRQNDKIVGRRNRASSNPSPSERMTNETPLEVFPLL